MTKLTSEPFSDIERFSDLLERLKNDLLNGSTAALEQMFTDRLEDLQRDELERRHEELSRLVDGNSNLRERAEELLDDGSLVSNPGGASEEELREEIRAMEQALADTEQSLETEPPTTEIDGNELFATFPFASDLNPDAVSVIVHYQNGTSHVVPQDYWTVESANIGGYGGDQVVVDGYPIPKGVAIADVEVTGVSEDGRLGSSRSSIINPAFDQDIPEVDAIDVSTLRPGVDERVGLSVRPGDETSFGAVERVEVYGPTGTELPTLTDENDRTTFTPTQTGVHNIRVTYSNGAGTNFVQSFRLNAKAEPTSDPPTVRIVKGLGGPLAIAGDQLNSARVGVEDGTAEIVAQAPGGKSPSNVDVRAEVLRVDNLNLKVVSGTDEQSVDNHVSVRLHTDFGTEETLIYRESAWRPITEGGETKYGSWETRTSDQGDTHRVISTYTDASGEVSISTSRDPGIFERVRHRIATTSPVELPVAALGGMVLHILDLLASETEVPMTASFTTSTIAVAETVTAATTMLTSAGVLGVTA